MKTSPGDMSIVNAQKGEMPGQFRLGIATQGWGRVLGLWPESWLAQPGKRFDSLLLLSMVTGVGSKQVWMESSALKVRPCYVWLRSLCSMSNDVHWLHPLSHKPFCLQGCHWGAMQDTKSERMSHLLHLKLTKTYLSLSHGMCSRQNNLTSC